jgi:hypothetical protein
MKRAATAEGSADREKNRPKATEDSDLTGENISHKRISLLP